MSLMGQKHALPHRTIAVRFTPINGHQCEGRSGRCVWTPGQASWAPWLMSMHRPHPRPRHDRRRGGL